MTYPELLNPIGMYAGVFIVTALGAYLGSYLKKKGENLATHEDIRRLVDQVRETERVKAEIADRMWDRQRRWDAKKDMYVEIYSSLHKLHDLLVSVGEGVRCEGVDQTRLGEAKNQLKNDFDKFSHVGFVAPLFFSDAALASIANITELAARWMTIIIGDELCDFGKVQKDFTPKFSDAVLGFSAAARSDLGYPSGVHSSSLFKAT
jgi:hypothetical protein